MSVKNQHTSYKNTAPKWKRCRDVAKGEDAVHGAGILYLPKLLEQTDKDYNAMRDRTTFYNASWRTIAGLVGMLFRKAPIFKLPDSVMKYVDDITMSGDNLTVFAQDISEEILEVGRVGILVDFPLNNKPVEGVVTLARAQNLGLRPTLQKYCTESIINWRMTKINNSNVLSMVVLQEEQSEYSDEFTETTKTVYRVLDLEPKFNVYRQRLFEIGLNGQDVQIGNDIFPLMNGKVLNYIPFMIIGVDGQSNDVDDPPLIDLVNVNLKHYRVTCDYEHACHFTALPTPYVTGYQKGDANETFYIGSTSAWLFADPNCKVGFLEYTGTGISAIEKNLESKEQQMAVLGARMLEALKRGVESAETASIHRVGEESMLAGVSQSISIALTKVMQWFSDWAGATGEVKIDLNKDFFPVPMSPQQITALIGAWQSGAISQETLFDNLKAGEVISEEIDFEEEQAKIAATPPPAPANATALGAGGGGGPSSLNAN